MAFPVQLAVVWSNSAKEKKFYQHLKAKFHTDTQSFSPL